jgi:hypothetical protein
MINTEVLRDCKCFSLLNSQTNVNNLKEKVDALNTDKKDLDCAVVSCSQCTIPEQSEVSCIKNKCVLNSLSGTIRNDSSNRTVSNANGRVVGNRGVNKVIQTDIRTIRDRARNKTCED